jgi:hypothetical protein
VFLFQPGSAGALARRRYIRQYWDISLASFSARPGSPDKCRLPEQPGLTHLNHQPQAERPTVIVLNRWGRTPSGGPSRPRVELGPPTSVRTLAHAECTYRGRREYRTLRLAPGFECFTEERQELPASSWYGLRAATIKETPKRRNGLRSTLATTPRSTLRSLFGGTLSNGGMT